MHMQGQAEKGVYHKIVRQLYCLVQLHLLNVISGLAKAKDQALKLRGIASFALNVGYQPLGG